jgi:hexosaminidase
MASVIPGLDDAYGFVTTPPGRGGRASRWCVEAADPELSAAASVGCELFEPHLDVASALASRRDRDEGWRVELRLDDHSAGSSDVPEVDDDLGDESYAIEVGEREIRCSARTVAGAFRGLVTVGQLLAFGELAPRRLEDRPTWTWRGLMLDPARHFVAPADLRRVIDLAALYKLNVLHLHLTDNEAWRIAIPGRPELTAAGEHYSVEEYRELQDYANARHVTIIPEIDLPGHCAALVHARPELRTLALDSRFERMIEKMGSAAAMRGPIDLGDPATADVVRSILRALCEMTSGPYVHVGGDEAMGMPDRDFHGAMRSLRAMVRDAGKVPYGWQESARAGLAPGDIAQFWIDPSMMAFDAMEEFVTTPAGAALGFDREDVETLRSSFAPTGEDLERIVAAGGRVVLSPVSHVYLDRPYAAGSIPAEQAEQVAHLGFPTYPPASVEDAAAWDPAALGVPADQLLGVEATLFGETLRSFEDLTALLLPRLAAVADTAWTGTPPLWSEHRRRLARHGRLWKERGLTYLASTEVDWSLDPIR